METYSLSLSLKLPDCVNVADFLACNLNPVVVLTDFRKSLKKVPFSPPTPPVTPPNELACTPSTHSSSFTTVPSSSVPASTKRPRKKRKSWDPSLEYEIDQIVGYHRDKRGKMWYLVKWKHWSSEHNTFEPIDNLTRCHQKLMCYFEMKPPTPEDLRRKDTVIEEGLSKRDIYNRLVYGGYKKDDLNLFSRECLDLKELFQVTDLAALERTMREEYDCIVRCLIGMYAHEDPGLVLRAQNYKLYLKLIDVRRQQLHKNAAIEKRINACEKTPLAIENKVDLDIFPDIEYIVEMRAGQGVVVPKEPLLGCDCPDGCTSRSYCCGKMADSCFVYGNNGRLRVSDRIAIYECNNRCKCPDTCTNRVVQRGRQVKLCIFKTKLCGWGVKAMEKIPKGTFVCQYIGELIPDSEAVVRDVKYSREKREGYLFDLDFFEDARLEMYCIDATEQGNLARFINHSCDPNLVVYPVWIDCLAPNLHLLAFFARRNISKGEEIYFDYENLLDDGMGEMEDDSKTRGVRMMSHLRCQCKAANCREWVFGNK